MKLLNIFKIPSYIYATLSLIHRKLYDFSILKRHFITTIVSVGNLTFGGRAKTDFTILLADFISKKGINTGILLKGYGGSKRLEAVNDNKPEEVSDEALIIKKELNMPIVVAKDKVLGAKKLLSEFNVECIVLDDGFQTYRFLKKIDFLILYKRDIYKEELLFRNFFLEHKRAHFIFIENCDFKPEIPHDYFEFEHSFIKMPENVPLEKLNDGVIITTLARSYIQKILPFKTISFPDHYNFTSSDIDFLKTLSRKKPLIMTMKEYVKLGMFDAVVIKRKIKFLTQNWKEFILDII